METRPVVKQKPHFGPYLGYRGVHVLQTRYKQAAYRDELQGELIPGLHPEFGLRQRLGRFYEVLTNIIYGGKLCKLQQTPFEDTSINSTPDLTHSNGARREVKAVAEGQYLKLNDVQIFRYLTLQQRQQGAITFEIFRHGVKNLIRDGNKRTLDNLLEDLANNTRYMISLPFSAIFGIYLSGTDTDHRLTSRYDGDKWESLTRLNSRPLNDFLNCPKKILASCGIDYGMFSFHRFRFPKGITISGHEIKPFPVLRVEEETPCLQNFDLDSLDPEVIPYNFIRVRDSFRDNGQTQEPLECSSREQKKKKVIDSFILDLIGVGLLENTSSEFEEPPF